MNTEPDPSLEDRLRAHYQHLREQPSAPRSVRRRPDALLVGVGCLALILAAGVAYLAVSSETGQPVQADVAATSDVSNENADSGQAAASETTEVPGPESVPDIRPSEPQPTTSAAPSPAPASADESTNADGSPVAPTPGSQAPPSEAELSLAYGIWEPSEHDTCSKAIHDSYWVYGPDGKVYPTYHPPIDPATGCTFGHEHGRDPSGSDLADIPFPFGYVNEQAIASGQSDSVASHVGHKIEWYNDGGYYETGSPDTNHDQICDVAYKLHIDTHSNDAFENNTHEVFHYARCENGSELIYRALHTFGNEGEFNMHCDQQAGPSVIGDQQGDQQGDRNDGDAGTRELPASECFESEVLVPPGQRSDWFSFDERWTLYQTVDSDDFGRFFIQFYFFADAPSRYWDGRKMARTVDLCYETGARQVRDDEFCGPMLAANSGRRVQWDDPASPFNGANRQVFMVDIRLDNAAKQRSWYTDVHGGLWRAEPFPGSIQQHVGTTPIDAAASYRPSPIRTIEFDDDLGLHAPN